MLVGFSRRAVRTVIAMHLLCWTLSSLYVCMVNMQDLHRTDDGIIYSIGKDPSTRIESFATIIYLDGSTKETLIRFGDSFRSSKTPRAYH